MAVYIDKKPILNVRTLTGAEDIPVGDLYLSLYGTECFQGYVQPGSEVNRGFGLFTSTDTTSMIRREDMTFFPVEMRDEESARALYDRISSPKDFDRESRLVLNVLRNPKI